MPLAHRRALLASALAAAAGTLPLARLARGQAAAAAMAAHRLTVLHVNDFHSRHEAVDGRALTCGGGALGDAALLAGRDGCFGGSARLVAAIAAQRAAAARDGRAVLVLDAGDQFQGSLFFTAHEGRAELDVMHLAGTEAMAVGNHEFDRGPVVLARFIRAARFPVLAANLDASASPELAGLFRPYALFDRDGLRLAVVGLTTEEARTTSSPGPGVRFHPPGPALARAAADARANGARLVIALSHLGVLVDRSLAAEIGTADGAQVFVGGHSHTLLSNTEAGALGRHPVLVPGPDGGVSGGAAAALVVQAGAYGRYLGRLDLDVAEDGTVVAWGGDAVHVAPDGPEDAEAALVVARYAAPLDAVRRRVVAELPEALDAVSCRVAECPFGNLAADALLHAAAGGGAEIGLMNAGGLRTGLPAGPVTLGQVLDAIPFGNLLATVELTGADLRAALEHGLGLLGRGAFPQVAGLRLAWDPARPAGERIASLNARGADGSWTPVEADRIYRVATNDFLRRGGDGYVVLRDRALGEPYDNGPLLSDLVAEALAASPTATGGAAAPGVEGRRITRLR